MKKGKSILVTGGSGFIGSNFLLFAADVNRLSDIKTNYSPKLKHSIIAPNHKELDITDIENLKRIFESYTPSIVINFAAHRNANTAELQRGDKKGSAWKSNVIGVKNLYKMSKQYNSFLIHISTDMVFSGREDDPGPYDEDKKPDKKLRNLSWYGWTKAEGERQLYTRKNAAIIRIGNVTKPVYDPKLDYVGKILYLFDQKKLYPLFNDQYLTLTSIPSLFEIITKLIKDKTPGIYHAASKDTFTPHGLAEYLVNKTRGKNLKVKSTSIDAFLKEKRNRYPKHGGLLAEKTSQKLGTRLQSWEEVIDLWAAPHFQKANK